jgi:hypothetical protein
LRGAGALAAVLIVADLGFWVGLFVWYESGPGAVLQAELAVFLLAGAVLFALREHARAPAIPLRPPEAEP